MRTTIGLDAHNSQSADCDYLRRWSNNYKFMPRTMPSAGRVEQVRASNAVQRRHGQRNDIIDKRLPAKITKLANLTITAGPRLIA